MTYKKLLLPLLLPLTLTLAACSDDNDGPNVEFKDVAVIATRAPDYSSGAISLVDQTTFDSQNGLAATTSDIAVRSGGDHYFLIERFGSNQIKRFDADDPDQSVRTYSTEDANETAQSNPYDIIIAKPDKAYLLRYGSGKLWIVDPSATTEEPFKTGEIDLSAYDADGVPEMSSGLIKDGKLYIAMQRLESFAAVKSGYVAVIDIATDQEITAGAAAAPLKGIELPIRNPSRLVSDPASRKIYVAGDGGYDGSFAALYEGGIVAIDPANSYETTLLLDDGTPEDAPYGLITDFVAITRSLGYFIGSTGFLDNQTLYRYDLSENGEVVAVEGLQDVGLTNGMGVDAEGQLWVGRTETPPTETEEGKPAGLTVLGFASGTETVVAPLIDTVLTPINIDFVTVEETTP